jgi:hypothetical protein
MPQGLEEPMWAAFRSLADLIASAKKTFPFVGTLLLIFLTVLLIDLQLYLSAAFAGVLAAGALCAYLVQTLRERKDERERERKNLLKAEKLAEKAGARGKKINKAKAAVTDAARLTSYTACRVLRTSTLSLRTELVLFRIDVPKPIHEFGIFGTEGFFQFVNFFGQFIGRFAVALLVGLLHLLTEFLYFAIGLVLALSLLIIVTNM